MFKNKDFENVDGFMIKRVTPEDIRVFREAATVIKAIQNGTIQNAVAMGYLDGLDNSATLRHIRNLISAGFVGSNSKRITSVDISAGITILYATERGESIVRVAAGSDEEVKREVETVRIICMAFDSYIP
ncbi:MAG: hypothetical protein KGH59_03305, partial [Candidatus Micrarchaeota archaeon]|nr:hypothetical protein [Candidatus Micrarchaeota archaeon]